MRKKNHLLTVLLSLSLLLTISCFNNSKSRLSRMIAAANKECPIETGIGTFDHIDYTNNKVTFEYTINSPMLSVDKFNKNPDASRKIFANNLTKGSVNEVLKEIVEAGASFCISIREEGTPAKASFDFSQEELKQIMSSPSQDDNETILVSEAMMLDLMAPVEVDEATVIKGGDLTSSAFIYQYEYDDRAVTASMLTKETIARLKEQHGEQLKMQLRTPAGVALKKCLQACIKTGRSLDNHYEGKNTGHVFEYGFSPSELEQLIRKSEALLNAEQFIEDL